MNQYRKIKIIDTETAANEKQYLFYYNNKYYEASWQLAELLSYLQKVDTIEEGVNMYLKNKGYRYTHEYICIIIEKCIDSVVLKNASSDNQKLFFIQRTLLKASTIDHLTNKLKFLFTPQWMVTFIFITVIADLIFVFNNQEENLNEVFTIYKIVGATCFMLASSLMHEIGHATACKYFGIKHGNIGIGLYLMFPVLYTDVTEAWKLKRKQRCVIDFAGIYFQMYLLAMLLVIYNITMYDILYYMILLMNFNFALTLNPFFKFDGYWMMTDLLGIANLRKKGNEWIKYVVDKIRGKKSTSRPYFLTLPSWAKWGLAIYTIVVNLFFCFYFFYVIPQFFIHFYQTFPDRLLQLMAELSYQQMPSWNNLQQIIIQLLFAFLFLYMTYRIISPLIRQLRWAKG